MQTGNYRLLYFTVRHVKKKFYLRFRLVTIITETPNRIEYKTFSLITYVYNWIVLPHDFFVAFFSLCIIWVWRNYPNLKDWKGELCLSFLLAGLLMWMGGAITKDYVVVEQRNGTIVHNSYECIGSPNIKLCDGTEIDSRQIRTGISGK